MNILETMVVRIKFGYIILIWLYHILQYESNLNPNIYIYNVNPGLINHGLLIRGVFPQ